MPDETCRAFDSVAPLDPNVLHRFVVGADPAPRKMSPVEVKALGDPFASLLLARGEVPRSGEELLAKIKAAVPGDDPLKKQSSFVLGEGSQLASTKESAGVDRTLRFVVTLGTGPEGPDIFLSVPDPKQPNLIEVMAWDRKVGGFNYYRSTGDGAMWMFAGNSRDALRDSSRRKGPFESHPSGALLMKELKTPWINWHSPAANIPETAFAKNDPRRTHEWFKKKEPGGALTFEFEAARPAMTRWAKARFATLRKKGGTVSRPRQIMEQILDTPTVNLATTHIESRALSPSDRLDLPTTFFVDSEGLSDILGLDPPPAFTVTGKIYARCLDKFEVRMDDGQGFTPKGDTHFCFLVPERAFEDQVVLREAVEMGLVSKRLATCLLMVDPWNPIFSDRRRALLRHVPATATMAKGKSSFTRDMAKAILEAAEKGPAGTPEAEFAKRWKVGTGFAGAFNKLLNLYYAAVTAQLRTQAGFDGYFKLAEERRRDFQEKTRIAEFPLLLPRTNIAPVGRRMQQDGTVSGG
jgi:hypothetical protein